ncbi:hypothetical protein CA13_15690 [Planctomycetes bacterium CA13]|uniref:Uncharacterized protein n=1 Tax=Novipirellula herctigrandis TaxID=2527986 RepID=A0A5C5YZI4_9BACT|nr:hypothetical protein CA13_15690 [Planctomycetes bacterium CA13]
MSFDLHRESLKVLTTFAAPPILGFSLDEAQGRQFDSRKP